MAKIRWGILGTGNIAQKFASDLKQLEDVTIHAVGSRKIETAKAFAERFSIKKFYGNSEELSSDPQVDIIYIATPHSLHKDHALLCLKHNKAVLCEKPFTINSNEAREVVELARRKNLFLMEAMWTRFLPLIQKMLKYVEEGLLGKIQSFTAELGFKASFDPQHRLFNPNLGGGALLDLGIYPIALSFWLLGPPKNIDTLFQIGGSGVDEQSCLWFDYEQGTIAKIFTSLKTQASNEAIIIGDQGRIRIHHPLYRPSAITVSMIGQKDEYFLSRFEGLGYIHQAREAMHCLRNQRTESALLPLDQTIKILETMDRVRHKWGLKYPQEI